MAENFFHELLPKGTTGAQKHRMIATFLVTPVLSYAQDQLNGMLCFMLLSRPLLNRLLKTATLFTVLQATVFPAQAELSANIGITSEYVRDGISETRGNPALQAGLTFRHDSGFYAGLLSSGLNRHDDSATFENDMFAGMYLPLADHLALDMFATSYTYAGDADIAGQAYNEGGLRILIDDAFMLGWRETGNYIGSGFDKRSLEMAYTLQWGEFSLEFLGAQHRWLEVDDEDYNFGEDTERDSYWQFRVGLDRSYGPWDFRLTLNRTNLSSDYDAGTAIQFGIQRYFNIW